MEGHRLPSDIECPSGYFIRLEAALDLPAEVAAAGVKMSVDDYLAHVERWADSVGLPYGVRVDREQRTVTQVGARL